MAPNHYDYLVLCEPGYTTFDSSNFMIIDMFRRCYGLGFCLLVFLISLSNESLYMSIALATFNVLSRYAHTDKFIL
jgi:hypothetical protein